MSPRSSSHLEKRFLTLWQTLAPDLPLKQEVSGLIPGKRYRYDFYCPLANALFEIQGGTYAKGFSSHSSGKGIARDADKVNQAQMQGYLVFQLPTDHLTKEYLRDVAEYCRSITTAN